MSESFDEVCTSYGDCTWIGRDIVKEVIARLQMAHEREIAEALCDACDQCDRMDKKAYEHKIEQIRKARFHEGYVAGQRSMDAEHRAVAMRLRGLRFDGGSHENLNKIAYAIYPCATGWTVESCEGLRDKIIELLGGVHDGVPDHVPCCACGDDSDNRDGQSEAVDVDGAIPDGGSDVPAAGGVGDLAAAQVAYDELGNERHKAVCRLREWEPDKAFDNDRCGEVQIRLLYQILDLGGAMMMNGADAAASVRDRLIHLLGGDEPTAMEYIQRIVREHDIKCSDMEPSGAELSQASVDAMSRRAESDKNGDICETEPRNTVESSKYRENYKSGHIADELREWASTEVPYKYGRQLHAIADRIDEQEHKLRKQRDGFKKAMCAAQDLLEKRTCERDELQAKLEEADAAIANWRGREKSFAESERLRDELQKMLDETREQREHWADEATKMYRLFFSHDEYCVPDNPSEMVADAVGTLREKYDGARGAIRHLTGQWSKAVKQRKKLQAKLDAIREAIDE